MRAAIALSGLLVAAAAGVVPAADFPDRSSRSSSGSAPPAAAAAPAPASPTRDTLVDLTLQLEQLQAELRSLRGQVETQNFELERLKARQRDVGADFDRRLREIERRGPAAGAERSADGGEAVAAGEAVVEGQVGSKAAASPAEQQAYDAAFALMKQGQYERAAKSFREFLGKYPKSPLADNAQYWIGEALYVGRNFRGALDEFGRVLSHYPKSDKIADALLKTGYCHQELGDTGKARDALNQVVARFPNTRAARSAQERLAKLKK